MGCATIAFALALFLISLCASTRKEQDLNVWNSLTVGPGGEGETTRRGGSHS